MRWVNKYKSTNNITRKKRDYSSYKITNSHILFINKQLKQNKTITMDELLAKLKSKYPDLILSRVHLGVYKENVLDMKKNMWVCLDTNLNNNCINVQEYIDNGGYIIHLTNFNGKFKQRNMKTIAQFKTIVDVNLSKTLLGIGANNKKKKTNEFTHL